MLFDALGAFEDMPHWEEAADSLFNAGLTINPSALHGGMVGLLAAGFSPRTEQHFSSTVAALEKALAVELTGDLVDFISRLSLATLSAIEDADYTFQPMLPPDDDALEERLLSVSEWSTGFLSGFTQGITIREAAGQPVAGLTAEALKDIAAIAQVDTEESDSENRQSDNWMTSSNTYGLPPFNTVMEAQALQETDLEDHPELSLRVAVKN